MFAALICILAPISIPAGVVPFTLGVFAVLLAAVVLEWKSAVVAVLIYILLGMIGLPVFSGGRGGFPALAGPTGGYIWSYVPMAILTGKMKGKGVGALPLALAGCIASLLICYTFGTAQFMLISGTDFSSALGICVLPFMPFDFIKALGAAILGDKIRRRI